MHFNGAATIFATTALLVVMTPTPIQSFILPGALSASSFQVAKAQVR